MEVITSTKGGRKLCHNHYMYTVQKTSTNFIHWRCVKRSNGCKSRLSTSHELEFPIISSDHNHEPNGTEIKVAKARTTMKARATATNDKPALIFAQTLQVVDLQTKTHMPESSICKRVIRRQRVAEFPEVPATLRDLVIDVDSDWAQTREQNPKRFLFYDNGPESDSRIIAFATDDHLLKLANSHRWMMDGCFSIAPAGFLQLYVVHAPLGEVSVPLVYALLQRKSQAAYEELLQAILDKCDDLGCVCDPEFVILDYETSVIQAVRSVLGDGTQSKGCFYHLAQSTWRKIQELGLVVRYKTEEDFRLFCGMLDGLAFLPVADVVRGMAHLREIAPDGADALMAYFDATYVNGIYRQRRIVVDEANRLQIRRIPARFPPELWNVHEQTLNDDPRTNNMCEGWNSRFSQLVGFYHPSIWKLIKHLQIEECNSTTMLSQATIGNPPKKRTKRVHIQQQRRLKTLCTEYSEGRSVLANFLRGVGHNIHIGH